MVKLPTLFHPRSNGHGGAVAKRHYEHDRLADAELGRQYVVDDDATLVRTLKAQSGEEDRNAGQ
jgi:hypothetical protein